MILGTPKLEELGMRKQWTLPVQLKPSELMRCSLCEHSFNSHDSFFCRTSRSLICIPCGRPSARQARGVLNGFGDKCGNDAVFSYGASIHEHFKCALKIEVRE